MKTIFNFISSSPNYVSYRGETMVTKFYRVMSMIVVICFSWVTLLSPSFAQESQSETVKYSNKFIEYRVDGEDGRFIIRTKEGSPIRETDQNKKLLFDGKIKKIFETDDEDKLIQEFKDDAGGLKGLTKHKIKNKGMINNAISAYIFEYLQSHHVGTYYISNLGDREMLIKKIKMIPIDIIIRNITGVDFAEKYGVEVGKELEYPIIEYYLKNEKLNNPLMTESHITALKLTTQEELKISI